MIKRKLWRKNLRPSDSSSNSPPHTGAFLLFTDYGTPIYNRATDTLYNYRSGQTMRNFLNVGVRNAALTDILCSHFYWGLRSTLDFLRAAKSRLKALL